MCKQYVKETATALSTCILCSKSDTYGFLWSWFCWLFSVVLEYGRIIRSICIVLCPRHRFVFQAGLKTGMYYLRTRAAADAIKFTVDQQALAKNKAAKAAKLAINPGAVSTPNPLKVWLKFHIHMTFEVLVWLKVIAVSCLISVCEYQKQACQHATPFWGENHRSELIILQKCKFKRNYILQRKYWKDLARLDDHLVSQNSEHCT